MPGCGPTSPQIFLTSQFISFSGPQLILSLLHFPMLTQAVQDPSVTKKMKLGRNKIEQ